MPKIQSPPAKKLKAKARPVKYHKKISMDKVTIKRVKRNKKETSTKAKILAGIGVGSTLLGGVGAVSPQQESKEFIRENTNSNSQSKTSLIKNALSKVFGIGTANASSVEAISQEVESAQAALDSFDSWYNGAMSDVAAFAETDQQQRKDDINSARDTERQALVDALNEARARLLAAQANGSSNLTSGQINNLLNPLSTPDPVSNTQGVGVGVGLATTDDADTTEPVEGDTRQGFDGPETYKDGQWVLNAGISVQNPNGYFYVSDGSGGWSLKDGQTKTESGTVYVSQNGQWEAQAVNEGSTKTEGGFTYTYYQGRWILDNGQVKTENEINYTSLDGTWQLNDGQTKTEGGFSYTSINHNWVLDDGQTKQENGQTYTSSGGQWILSASDSGEGSGPGGGREVNNYTEGQSAGFIDGDSSRPAIWHNAGTRGAPDWQQVDASGNNVTNGDTFIYTADGRGGWTLKDGQTKTENGKNYISRGGSWVEEVAGVTLTDLRLEETSATVKVGESFTKPVAIATYSDGTTSQIQGIGDLRTSSPGVFTINYTAGDKTISFTLTVVQNAQDPVYPTTVTSDINNSRTGVIVVNNVSETVSVISDGLGGNYVFDSNGNEITSRLVSQGVDITALARAFASATVSNSGPGGGRETNNYTEGQSAGFVYGDTSRPAVWHNQGTQRNPDWVQVDKSGNEVRNSDGFIHVADGSGGWVLKSGQHKTESGKNYTSNSLGQWIEDAAGTPTIVYPTTVTSDINNSRTGTIIVNGQSIVVSVIPGGYVFDSNGNEITSELVAQGISIDQLFSAFNQARVTTSGGNVTAGTIATLPVINNRPTVSMVAISSAVNASALTTAVNAARSSVDGWKNVTAFTFNSWLSEQNARTDLTAEQKAEAARMVQDFINGIADPIYEAIAQAQTARAAQLVQTGVGSSAPVVTRTASGGFTITMGNLTFTGANVKDVEAQLQAAYSSYLGYANGNVKIDLNTYNALAAALTSSASGVTVNPATGSLGAYYEQGDVRVYRNPDGTYRIEILTNEPVLNPQTGQRGYNLILTGTSTASLVTLINQALRNVSGDTTLLLQNAISDISLFNNQERTGQLRFTFQTNPNLNNPNGTGNTAQNAFHFATKETADAVVAMLKAAGLSGVTVTSQPVGNLTQYYVSFEGTNYQGNAGLIANLIQTGGVDAAVNMIKTELAEGKGDYKTMYLGVGSGGVVGSTNNYKAAPVGAANIPVFNSSANTGSTGVNTQTNTNNSSSQTLPTGFILPPGGFPAGTVLPNGLKVSPDGKSIIDSQGKVVAPNGTQTTQTGTTGTTNATTNTSTNTATTGTNNPNAVTTNTQTNNNTNTLGQVTTTSLAVGTVGVSYSQKLESTLSNETWGILGTAGLPQGLTLNSQTGVISGTPTTAGAYNIVVVATSGNSSAIKVFTLVINTATNNNNSGTTTPNTNNSTAQITTASLSVATVGSSYSFQLESTLSNETWGILGTAGLPQGLTLNSQTGVISGTPTMAGNYTFVVAATSGSTSVVRAFTLTVNSATVTNTGNNGGSSQTGGSTGGGGGTTSTTNNLDNAAITALQAQIAALQNQINQLNNSGQNSQITALQNQVSNLTNLLSSYNNRGGVVASAVTGLQMANLNNGLEPGYTPEGYANTNRPVGLAMPAGYKASGAQIADTGIPAGFYFGSPQGSGLQMQAGSEVQGAATVSTTYVVKKGDTLWNIAKKYYGDGKQWRKIMEENTDKVKNPKTLKIGTVLVIPGVNK